MSLIRVNMTKKEVISETFPKDKIIGGRAMIDYLLTEFACLCAHPLSEKSLFVVAPGLLSGTAAPQSGRISVGGKSPLTGGIREANSGGTAAHKLSRLGIRAIMVEGKSRELQILKVNSQGATFEDAMDIVGMTNYAACDKLRQHFGEKISIMITGPAGERKLANSTVAITDLEGRPSRHAARGGIGAIMGAKGLKAIVIDDSQGALRKAANEGAFKKAAKAATEVIKKGHLTEPLHNLGTSLFVDIDNGRGSLPTYNHRMGSFDKYQNINAERLTEVIKGRCGSMGHSCMPGCVVRCSNVFNNSDGNFVTAALEYETIAMIGSNLGIDDLDAIARIDRKCDELGIDTIELGCAVGVLNDAGLFNFGDSEKVEGLIEEIAMGTPMGRIIGSGVAVTAKIFGIERIPAVKGLGIPAHAARSCKGWGVTYATSPQGADHTAGPVFDDPLSPEGQGERSRMSQIAMAAFDATGLCLYTFLREAPDVIVSMINAFYGIDWTVEDYMKMGKEMLRKERVFNLNTGIGPAADRLPDWMSTEPLPPTNAVFDVPQKDIDAVFDF